MRNLFVTSAEACAIIRSGAIATFAGSEAALSLLQPGQWIGGTTVYFMTSQGGVVDSDRLFCTIIDAAVSARFACIASGDIPSVTTGQYENGFTYIMVPAFSEAHRHYAIEAPSFPDLYSQPLIGWVTGVPAEKIGQVPARVFFGPTGESFDDALLALYVELPEDLCAVTDTVNLFTQGYGPSIVFPRTSFSARDCLIDGVPGQIGRYLSNCDTKLPLVADYAGIMMNVGIRSVDAKDGSAQFYAPVVSGEPYRLAQSIHDYPGAYRHGAVATVEPATTISCNCILNFLYAGLEGKSAGGYIGPVTFGEISYILVNQTLVRLSLESIAGAERDLSSGVQRGDHE